MEKQVELTLTNNSRNLLVLIGGLIIIWLAGIEGNPIILNFITHFIKSNTDLLVITLIMLELGGGFMIIFLLARKLGGERTLITIAADELRVLNHQSGRETRILFAAIASYDTTFFNGIEELRLKLRDGSELKLSIDTNLQKSQLPEFLSLVSGFEIALNQHQSQQLPGEAAIRRNEFAFWTKPLATVILVGFACLIAFTTYTVVVSPGANSSFLFVLYSFFAAYAAGWYRSRSQRRR